MRKKHFEWAARWIRSRYDSEEISENAAIILICFCVEFFQTFNPRFDTKKFMEEIYNHIHNSR